MATEEKDMKKVLTRVGDLLRLANDGDGAENRNAALQVANLLKEHELVLIPRSELERIKTMVAGSRELAARHKEEAQSKMIMGAIGGMLLAKQFKF